MHCPIDSKPNNILLEPIYKKKKNLLKRSLCVYVNNTKRYQTLEKEKKKKKKFVAKKSIRSDAMVTPTDDFRKICPPTICSCGFAIQAWSVINRNKRCVLCSLYLSLVWMHRLKIK